MALAAEKLSTMSYAEYLAFEEQSNERHIFWEGELFAMSGGSQDHYALESKIHGLLFAGLGTGPCRAYTGNMRLRPLDGDDAVYADAVVVCGPREPHPEDPGAVTNPSVIVEVLSPTTERFDRGDKFTYYRSFPSIQHVVFLSQKALAVEHYSRQTDGTWRLTDLRPGDALALLGLSLRVEDIYADTSLMQPVA